MGKTYEERLEETRNRSWEENIRLYNQRKTYGWDCGVLERVIAEQAAEQADDRRQSFRDKGEFL